MEPNPLLADGRFAARRAEGSTVARTPPSLSASPRRAIARSRPIPGGVTPVRSARNSVDGQLVVNRMNELGRSIDSPFRGFNNTHVQRDVVNAFESANLQPRSIEIHLNDDRGINMNWRGTINIRMENERPVGAEGVGTSTATGGGTGTSGMTQSTTNTDTAGVGGKVSGEQSSGGNKQGGEISGSASTSSATTAGTSQGSTGSATTGASSVDRLQRYECTIVAEISLTVEPDFSGTDYVNPFKWGFAGARAVMDPRTTTGSVQCGTWTYEASAGFAPPPPATPAR